ncbi:MAG: GIY-YIG nuclease family protein [Bacteroidaceae bacterium]|nr:GIY-YIG nuclease family protein [Bacteroidaceae bacterium]
MANKEPGYVYIFTNDSFRDDWVKIGKTTDLKGRLKTLFNTSLPLPFKIYATIQTTKYEEVERIIHKQIDRLTDLRINQNREFFNVHPTQALDIFLDQAQVLDDAVVIKYKNNEPDEIIFPRRPDKPSQTKPLKQPQRKPFDFSMVGLNVGDIIIFDALNLPVKVAGKNKVEHEGRLWSLSAFCGTYLPENMHNKSEAYQGPKYFSYNGKTLWNIRLGNEGKE